MTQERSSAPRHEPPLVLCVDDTPNILMLVRTVLSKAGFRVLTATNGGEALAILAQQRPDAVLLDIAMPGMGGMDALARMAADPALAAIPVMMLTSNSQERNVRAALALGARDFVVKPFAPDHLVHRLRRLLEGSDSGLRAEPSTPPPAAPERLDVLVAAANPELVATIGRALGSACTFASVSTASGAAALAQRRQPRVIFLDLRLPVPEDVEAARRLGQNPFFAIQRLAQRLRLTGARVVAIRSGDARDEPLLAAFDGAVEHPVDPSGVLRHLP